MTKRLSFVAAKIEMLKWGVNIRHMWLASAVFPFWIFLDTDKVTPTKFYYKAKTCRWVSRVQFCFEWNTKLQNLSVVLLLVDNQVHPILERFPDTWEWNLLYSFF